MKPIGAPKQEHAVPGGLAGGAFSIAAARLAIRRQGQACTIGTAPAAARPRADCGHRSAAGRSRRWTAPSSSAPQPAPAPCGQPIAEMAEDCAPIRRAGRAMAKVAKDCSIAEVASALRKNSFRNTITAAVARRCRSRRTRSWCRSGWRADAGRRFNAADSDGAGDTVATFDNCGEEGAQYRKALAGAAAETQRAEYAQITYQIGQHGDLLL